MFRKYHEAILVDNAVVYASRINFVDITKIEQQEAVVHTYSGEQLTVSGFAALELVWHLKPSALEGKRLKWPKHAWAVHNLFAHPLLQLLAFVGLARWGMWIHDVTVPKPSK